MSKALMYSTGSCSEYELEFIIELYLPDRLEEYTDGEIVCHVYPQEDSAYPQVEFSYSYGTGEFLAARDRLKRLAWAVIENYKNALATAEEEEDFIELKY